MYVVDAVEAVVVGRVSGWCHRTRVGGPGQEDVVARDVSLVACRALRDSRVAASDEQQTAAGRVARSHDGKIAQKQNTFAQQEFTIVAAKLN